MAAQVRNILILSFSMDLVMSKCQQNTFKSDAADKIKAAYRTIQGKEVDYSKIEVEWQPHLMVENPSCINEDQLFLEVNHNGGDDGWTIAGGEMELSGPDGRFRWSLDVVPCKDHYFRVWVDGDGNFLLNMDHA